MKLLYLLISVLFLACLGSKVVEFNRTGMVECTSKDRTTLTLTSTSQAENKNKASEFSIRNAFENLLFKGVPNSNQEKALISNEIETVKNNSVFFNNLLNGKEYEKFVISVNEVKSFRSNGMQNVQNEIKIDLKAFTNYLEQNKIIKKFGL